MIFSPETVWRLAILENDYFQVLLKARIVFWNPVKKAVQDCLQGSGGVHHFSPFKLDWAAWMRHRLGEKSGRPTQVVSSTSNFYD